MVMVSDKQAAVEATEKVVGEMGLQYRQVGVFQISSVLFGN